MKYSIPLFALLFTAAVSAQEAPPAAAVPPPDPAITIHVSDLQHISDFISEAPIPAKYSLPVLQAIQQIVQKGLAQKAPPSKSESKPK